MSTRGRPAALNWNEVTPALVDLRAKGATYNDLVDYIADTHGINISTQTVRLHIQDQVKDLPPRPAPPSKNDPAIKAQVYQWLTRHPEASIPEIAEGTGLSLDAVIAVHDIVRNENSGYTIIPPRTRRELFSETEMLDALADAMDAMSLPAGSSMSQGQYASWREALPAEEKRLFPSPLAYRRRYGSWGDAMEAAGLPRNDRHREYEGIERPDAIVWLAHFLRYVRGVSESQGRMLDATATLYRQWLRENPTAPSEELLRIKGSWGQLLVAAAEIERTEKTLPEPRPVWTGGRKKRERPVWNKTEVFSHA